MTTIAAAVTDYYSRALAEHGPTHRGVDWPTRASQHLRFTTLLDGIDWPLDPWAQTPTLLDYGCGYGALADHVGSCDYTGYDLVPSMIAAARAAYPHKRFTADADALRVSDHVIASGIFNVRDTVDPGAWSEHVDATLERLAGLTRRRLAFNMLPPVSGPEFAREHLHHADPQAVVARCERYGAVELREDYGLWEFTVVVTVA